ncbi:DNA-binding GntR family transcriptional regulator [Paenibacillus forsythiae]|uniref:DNA-binding GntR family transcriptional regulator n=1 Tax=Paenibacillus forsythiae TaxID=365616 RepID=A0ABU3H8Y0_9BACL|nr:GntR family transcriptional regulator [Paenibacillus forsythiae]MDT3427206.1 DNA-binding GntR family transcriptional regulator [Paenibacillus forsythiae]
MDSTKFNLKPIDKPSTTKERVYNEIKHVILSGYISSEEIFTEVKLAELLNTSRTPVREALQDLIKEGLIVSIPRKGMAVRSVTESEIEQIFLLRTSIETKIIRKLAKIITPEQLKMLKNICKQQKEAMLANDDIAFIKLDQLFHTSLVKFVDFELIEQVLLNLHNLSQLIGLRAIKKSNRMNEVLEEHMSIISCMESKDEEKSGEAMTLHLNNTKQTLIN